MWNKNMLTNIPTMIVTPTQRNDQVREVLTPPGEQILTEIGSLSPILRCMAPMMTDPPLSQWRKEQWESMCG